jgi:hypothetical protein
MRKIPADSFDGVLLESRLQPAAGNPKIELQHAIPDL